MKNTKIILSLLLLLTLIASGCAAMPEDYPEETAEAPSEVMLSLGNIAPSDLADSQNIQLQFNLDLLKLIAADKQNTFYSSFSINQALTMAYFGAKGDTQDEIRDMLGYAGLTMEDIAAYQKYLADTYENPGDTTFYSANSLWIDDQIIVKDGYINTMKNSFAADVENLDLQSADALGKLNGWVDDKTQGMIKKLFDDPLGDMARLVIMNAIYFKGDWTTPFDPAFTNEGEFFGQNGTAAIDLMFSNESVMGYETDDYKSISLPYGEDERFAFVAVLPNSDINDFIEGLSAEQLQSILTTFEEKSDTSVLLPKFEMEEKLELNDILKSLGMETAFTNDADFSEITDTPLAISDVLHKAKIKVDEEGTEAAAVTGLVFRATSMPMDIFEFHADRPFMFFIVDTEDDTVLFTGVMYDAQK